MRLDVRRLGGVYLPLVLAGLLAAWFALGREPTAPERTRLMVLLVTTSAELSRHAPVWQAGTPHDAQGYVELLSAANIPFQVMWMERFEMRLPYLVEDGLRKYTTVILATSARNLSDRSVEALLLASERYGVSLLAAGEAVDHRLRLAFGIRQVRGPENPEPRVRALPWAEVRRGTDRAALVLATRFGRAVNYYFARGGQGFLDGHGPEETEVREALLANAGYGMVRAALAGVAALRMDDALFNGSAFLEDRRWPGGVYRRMDEAAWEAVHAILRRYAARMSVGVVTGYVDDGDPARGELYRRDRLVADRRCGTVYDSREMRYRDVAGPRPGRTYDYESEYRGLLAGVQQGLLDPEVHGFTHVSPDRSGWCQAEDRFTNFDWLKELAPARGAAPTLADQRRVIEEGVRRVSVWFERPPSTLIPPSHGLTAEIELLARDLGLRGVSAVFFTLLRPDRVIQNGKLKTFWAHWDGAGLSDTALGAGYPVVAGLHDRELVRRGPGWFDEYLAAWRRLGVRRFVTLRELAAHLGADVTALLEAEALDLAVAPARVRLSGRDGPGSLEVPLRLRVRLPAGRTVREVWLDGRPFDGHASDGEELELALPAPAGRERLAVRILLSS